VLADKRAAWPRVNAFRKKRASPAPDIRCTTRPIKMRRIARAKGVWTRAVGRDPMAREAASIPHMFI